MNSTAVGLLCVSIILPLTSFFAVYLRLAAHRVGTSLQLDDWVIVLAQIFCLGLGVNTIIGAAKGLIGKPQKALGMAKMVVLLKIIYADVFLSVTALGIVKISVLLFYKRVFPIKNFLLTANIMIGMTVSWLVAILVALLLSQIPISSHWDPNQHMTSSINFSAFLLAHAATDLLLDIAILCLPVPVISTLHMNTRRKIGLIGIFWLGAFCTVAAAVRIYYFKRFLYEDRTRYADIFGPIVANILIWSRIEPCCSVIAACLPTLRPLLKKRGPQSIVASIRSVISLSSLTSGSSGQNAKRSKPDELEESRRNWARLNNSAEAHAERDLEATVDPPSRDKQIIAHTSITTN